MRLRGAEPFAVLLLALAAGARPDADAALYRAKHAGRNRVA